MGMSVTKTHDYSVIIKLVQVQEEKATWSNTSRNFNNFSLL